MIKSCYIVIIEQYATHFHQLFTFYSYNGSKTEWLNLRDTRVISLYKISSFIFLQIKINLKVKLVKMCSKLINYNTVILLYHCGP